jgi:hypothetical protein
MVKRPAKLYEKAQKAGIPGRSQMNKQDLIKALGDPPDDQGPATRQA